MGSRRHVRPRPEPPLRQLRGGGGVRENYPTLRQDFAAVVRQLNAQPVTVASTIRPGRATTWSSRATASSSPCSTGCIAPSDAVYPGDHRATEGGTHTLLAQLMQGTLAKPFSYSRGMEYFMCSDVVRFERYDDEVASARGVMPEIRAAIPNVPLLLRHLRPMAERADGPARAAGGHERYADTRARKRERSSHTTRVRAGRGTKTLRRASTSRYRRRPSSWRTAAAACERS